MYILNKRGIILLISFFVTATALFADVTIYQGNGMTVLARISGDTVYQGSGMTVLEKLGAIQFTRVAG
jgi:hypothetical protein